MRRVAVLPEIGHIAVLVILVTFVWSIVYGRTDPKTWRVPIQYEGDTLSFLAQLKAARDGYLVPVGMISVPDLNAPYTANWNDYPRPQKGLYWMAGLATRVAGLFLIANLLLLLSHALAAIAFYVVARSFRSRREWAFAGACAFALSPFLFYRSLPHLMLGFIWPIPLAILVVTWCAARGGVRVGSRRFWLGVAVALVVGLHNIYYAGLFTQFLVLASLTHLLFRRGRGATLVPLLLVGVLLAAVAADNANTIAYAWTHGPGLESAQRPYGNLERFALKPIELLLPPRGYGLAPWRSVATAYYESALYRGEMGSAYLGLAGIASLAWLVFTSVAAYQRRPKGFLPGAFLAVVWVLVYSAVGGLNGIVGALGFVWFRATNRYSIWILALVLLWAVVRLSRTPWTRHRGLSLLAAAMATGLILADQLPPPMPRGEIQRVHRALASDETLVQSIEAVLPVGAMLFQLPVVEFPEGQPIRGSTGYEHVRPYLFSTRLRFSYGSDKGRPRDQWQARVEELPAEQMANALERFGFAGLLVIRKAYEDGGRDLRERLAAVGRPEAWESPDGQFLLIRLHPAAEPVLPDATETPAVEGGAKPR